MKKLITFGSIGIIACIGFSSCTSTIAITKRHYNKGYYIDYSGSKPTALIVHREKATPKASMPAISVQAKGMLDTKVTISAQTPKTNITPIGTNAGKIFRKPISTTTAAQMIKNLPLAIETTIVQMRPTASAINTTADDDHHRRDGLSLFWLVILIILILWALGLLAGGLGLGGLINILLVIALILLILWLLRIV